MSIVFEDTSNMTPKTKKCLIINWCKLPRAIKNIVSEWEGFHNNCFIPCRSEFEAKDYKKGLSSINEYYQDQVKINGFDGSFDDFIEDYCLDFDIWIIAQGFDFDKIDMILIEVSW